VSEVVVDQWTVRTFDLFSPISIKIVERFIEFGVDQWTVRTFDLFRPISIKSVEHVIEVGVDQLTVRPLPVNFNQHETE
jgi:hypothetical protein